MLQHALNPYLSGSASSVLPVPVGERLIEACKVCRWSYIEWLHKNTVAVNLNM